MSRERPSDRWHNARLLGSILLAVAQASGECAEDEQVCPEDLTAASLARQVGTAESQLRVWAAKLVGAGCLSDDRVSVMRENCARRVHVYRLPHLAEQRGLGRRPRWLPVALVVDPFCAAAEHTELQRATQGMLAVAVADRGDALRLLSLMAFELVAEIQPAPVAAAADEDVDELQTAARCANCGPFLELHATGASSHAAVSISVRSRWSRSEPAVAGSRSAAGSGLH